MRYVMILGMTLAAAAAAVAGEAIRKHEIVLATGDETVTIDAADLADGETRTIEANGKTIQITRNGDQLSVSVDGQSVEALGAKKVYIHETKTETLDAEVADRQRQVFVFNAEADGPGAEVRLEALEAHLSAEGFPDGARVLRWHQDSVSFHCPEDGSVLHVKKQHAGDGPFLCPLDGRPMEQSEGPLAVFGHGDAGKPAASRDADAQ
jgi:hypothetical protein